MGYRKACARTLDRPILIFGLEPEDLMLVGIVAGAVLFLVDPVPAVILGAVMWILLVRVKSGRPPGYLFTLLYRIGFCPRVPNLVRPSKPWESREIWFTPFCGEDRHSDYYWKDRPRL